MSVSGDPILQGLIQKNVIVPIPIGQTIYRGVGPKVNNTNVHRSFNVGGSTWFTSDVNHDFICAKGNQRAAYKIGNALGAYGLVNLKDATMQAILNRAIDLLADDDIKMIKSWIELLEPQLSIPNDTIKNNLKAVYGGISMQEQMSLMDSKIFAERLQRTKALHVFLKSQLRISGFRYSTQLYDRLLLYIIAKIFNTRYKIFNGVIGWYHEPVSYTHLTLPTILRV